MEIERLINRTAFAFGGGVGDVGVGDDRVKSDFHVLSVSCFLFLCDSLSLLD